MSDVGPTRVVSLMFETRRSAHRLAHHRFDLAHPHLDRAARVQKIEEGHLLLLGRDHLGHLVLGAAHRDLLHRLEALAQVGLHRTRVLRLTEDADELVVGEEVEAGECRPFRLQIVGQILLHPFELGVRLCEGYMV